MRSITLAILLGAVLQAQQSEHSRIGQAFVDAGRFREALPHLEEAVRSSPLDSPAVFDLGIAQLETGKSEAAFDTFSQLLAREPEEIGARTWLARTALRLKKMDAARAALSEVRRQAPTEALLHAQLVEWLFQEEGGALTADQIRFTLRLALPAEREARVHYLAALLDQRSRRLPQALDQARAALTLDPAKEEYYAAVVNLGGLSGVDKIDQSVLRLGLERFPDSKDLLIAVALNHMRNSETTSAFEIAQRLEQLYPDSSEVHVLRGRLELANLSYQTAAQQFRKAIELRDNNISAHYHLGICLRRMGSDPEAARQFEKALALDPDDPDALLEYGRVLYDLGSFELAANAFASVLQLRPGEAIAYSLMSRTARRLGRTEEAERYATKFKEISRAPRP